MRRLCIALVAAVFALMLMVGPVMADSPVAIFVPSKAAKGAEMANSHKPLRAPAPVLIAGDPIVP